MRLCVWGVNREARRKKKDSALRVNLFKSTLLEHAGSGGTRSCHSRPPTAGGGGGEKTKHTSGLLFAHSNALLLFPLPFKMHTLFSLHYWFVSDSFNRGSCAEKEKKKNTKKRLKFPPSQPLVERSTSALPGIIKSEWALHVFCCYIRCGFSH